jgi:hypothetical protein
MPHTHLRNAGYTCRGSRQQRPCPSGGHRLQLSLTNKGKQLVASVQQGLEERLAALIAHSGVPYAQYAEHTAQLLATFDRLERERTK